MDQMIFLWEHGKMKVIFTFVFVDTKRKVKEKFTIAMKSNQLLLIVYQKEKFLKCINKILYFFKKKDYLEELKNLERLQSQLRLSKRLNGFSYESQNVSEPVIKAALNANKDKSKSVV